MAGLLRDPDYYLARLRLLEELMQQMLAFIPDEAAIGIANEYNSRLAQVELLFPEQPPGLIVVPH